jgi:U2-associated protein SR140
MVFSLKPKNAPQAGSKAKAEADEKARAEKLALDSVMAETYDEHGVDGPNIRPVQTQHLSPSILGDPADDVPPDAFVPTGAKRHFTARVRSGISGPGTLKDESPLGLMQTGAPAMSQNQGPGAPNTRPPERNWYSEVIAIASNLPPTMDTSRMETLFSGFPALRVVNVEKLPMAQPTALNRPSASMIITFSKDAKAKDLDVAMMKLNDKKYMGRGYYLHLDRYLGPRDVRTREPEEPFGARLHKPDTQTLQGGIGVAPPVNLGGHIRDLDERYLVTANAPPDPATLRLIHQTIEKVIEGGTEFEAALMNNLRVQEEERFAWLYDSRHALGRYYRLRLHQIVAETDRTAVFLREHDWKGPKEPFTDEFASAFEQLDQSSLEPPPPVSDDEEASKPARLWNSSIGDNYPGRDGNGYGILSPGERAMLIWMLASVPPSTLMNDEVASITHLAMEQYTNGMDEVASLLISNIFQPFALTKANTKNADIEGEAIESRNRQQLTINALHIVHDVINVAMKEANRYYKYRGHFGEQLRERGVFEFLDTLPAQLGMGLLAEKKFRDSVNEILEVWDKASTYEPEILKHFVVAFNSRKEKLAEEEQIRKRAEKPRKNRGVVPQKRITQLDGPANNYDHDSGSNDEEDAMDLDDNGLAVIGAAVATTTHINNLAAVSALVAANDYQATADAFATETTGKMATGMKAQSEAVSEIPGETAAARARRLRPKAEDMFASDEEL